MGFVSGPAFLETFAVLLGSDVASGRQAGAHSGKRPAGLTLQSSGAREGTDSSLRGRPDLRGGGGASLGAGFSPASPVACTGSSI